VSSENGDDKQEQAKDKYRQLLAASALVPVLYALGQPANFKPLIFTVFVINYLLHSRVKSDKQLAEENAAGLERRANKILPGAEFIALFVAAGLMVQLFDLLAYLISDRDANWEPWWLAFSLGSQAPGPTNFSLQFGLSALCLASLALVWLGAMKIFSFTYRQIFLTALAFGMLTVLAFVLITQGSWLDILTGALESGFYYASIVGIALTPLALIPINPAPGAITAPGGRLNFKPETTFKRYMKYVSTIMALILTMAVWKVIF